METNLKHGAIREVEFTRTDAIKAGSALLGNMDTRDVLKGADTTNSQTLRAFLWQGVVDGQNPEWVDGLVKEIESDASARGFRVDRKSSTVATLASETRRVMEHPLRAALVSTCGKLSQALQAIRRTEAADKEAKVKAAQEAAQAEHDRKEREAAQAEAERAAKRAEAEELAKLEAIESGEWAKARLAEAEAILAEVAEITGDLYRIRKAK